MQKKKTPKGRNTEDTGRTKVKTTGQAAGPTRPKQDHKGKGRRVAKPD